MGEVALMGVEVVEDHVGIGGAACSKDDDFCECAQLSDEVKAMRSDADSCLHKMGKVQR